MSDGHFMKLIYVALLDEGTDCWRPVNAIPRGHNEYEILGPIPEDEKWAFQPGDTVQVIAHTFSGGQVGLVAISLAKTE